VGYLFGAIDAANGRLLTTSTTPTPATIKQHRRGVLSLALANLRGCLSFAI